MNKTIESQEEAYVKISKEYPNEFIKLEKIRKRYEGDMIKGEEHEYRRFWKSDLAFNLLVEICEKNEEIRKKLLGIEEKYESISLL